MIIRNAAAIFTRSLGLNLVSLRTYKHWPEQDGSLKIIMPPKLEDRLLPSIPHTPPNHPPGVLPPLKYPKADREMRGPEKIHNQLIYRQYGLIALGGGALEGRHFDLIRDRINRYLDPERFFAIWRVDPPWKPVSRKSQGKRMGGGKAKVHHYETPVRAGRMLIEIAGIGQFEEFGHHLVTISNKLPIYAMPITQEIMDNLKREKEELDAKNYNPFQFKDLVMRNFSNSFSLISKQDF